MYASASAPALGGRAAHRGPSSGGGADVLPPVTRSSSYGHLPIDSFALAGGSFGSSGGSRPNSQSGTVSTLKRWVSTSSSTVFPSLTGGQRSSSSSRLPSASRSAPINLASTMQETPLSASSPRDRISYLDGISCPIEVQNLKVGTQQRGLQTAIQPAACVRSRMSVMEGWGAPEDFERDAVALVSSMGDLLKRHGAFEGPFLHRSLKGNLSGGKVAQKAEGEDEERDKRRKRLEAYKMVRKLEPELPPLAPCVGNENAIMKSNMNIVHLNTGQDALMASTRDAKQVSQAARSKLMRERQARALEVSQLMLEEHRVRCEEDMKRKMQNAEKHLLLKAKAASDARKTVFPAHSWFTFCVVHAFAKALKEEVVCAKLPPKEREAARAARRRKPQDGGPSAHMEEALATESVLKGFTVLVARLKARVQIFERRRAAGKIMQALHGWRDGGRFIVSLQMYAKTVRRLQRWWRACSKKLREVKEGITRRWEKLERDEIKKEMNNRGGTKKKQLFVSLEDRIDFERVDEGVRSRFLDHELRARRYALLPAIKVWEEQMRKWKKECSDLVLTADAAGALNVDKKEIQPQSFSWPPEQPLYIPADHPEAEKETNQCPENCPGKRGHPEVEKETIQCPENCPGRRGDAEILAMLKAARENPGGGGWKEIPAHGSCTALRANGKKGRVATKQNARDSGGSAEIGQFGDAPEEECRRWGVHVGMLPSTDGPRDVGETAGATTV